MKVVWLAPGTGWQRGGGSGKRSNRSTKRETEEEEEEGEKGDKMQGEEDSKSYVA